MKFPTQESTIDLCSSLFFIEMIDGFKLLSDFVDKNLNMSMTFSTDNEQLQKDNVFLSHVPRYF